MGERFKQWQSQLRGNKRRVMGAIATPAVLWMVGWMGFLPTQRLQSDAVRQAPDRPSQTEPITPTRPQHETLVGSMGAIAAVTGSLLLVLKLRTASNRAEATDLSGANLSGADFSGADLNGVDLSKASLGGANLSGADLRGANLNAAELSGADLSQANLSGANLIQADLSGADLNRAEFRYADLSDADLRYANLSDADLRYANLSGADLNCALLSGANLSDANLSGALLFFINSRDVLNLEPLQLAAKPSPFLCNVALPSYSYQPDVDPNRDCDRIPQLLSARYDIPLEEAKGIVDEARQHRWD